MICTTNKIFHVHYNSLNTVHHCAFTCTCIRLYVLFWMMIKLASPTTNDNRWLMADVWTSSCHMDTNGANLTCWLCLINCRFDNSNIIWHYTREKITVFTVALSKKRALVRFRTWDYFCSIWCHFLPAPIQPSSVEHFSRCISMASFHHCRDYQTKNKIQQYLELHKSY